MPPRQGQSQFISPVSGLNAPSEAASSSSSSAPLSDVGAEAEVGAESGDEVEVEVVDNEDESEGGYAELSAAADATSESR